MAKVLFYFWTRPPVAIRHGNICFLRHVPPQVTCLDRMGFRRSLRGGWPCDPGLPEGQGLSSDATSQCTGSKPRLEGSQTSPDFLSLIAVYVPHSAAPEKLSFGPSGDIG